MEKQNSCVIPSDIIKYDILTRVPLESMVRFRCVCKAWSNLLVDNQLFIKLHSQRCNKSYSSGFIHTEYQRDPISHEFVYSLGFVNLKDKIRRTIPCRIPFSSSSKCLVNSDVYIMHSLNGLLLLRCYHDYSYKYYVYNPITRCSIIIPVPTHYVQPGQECLSHFCLCYDSLIGKHKVVFCGPYKRKESSLRKIKILTVGDGLGAEDGDEDDSWRDIVIPDAFDLYDYQKFAAMLYTVCQNKYLYRMVEPHGSDCYILRLDATREMYNKIKLPDEVSTLNLIKYDLTEMDGLLCLSHYTIETHELRMWTLIKNDYDSEEQDEHEWVEMRLNINIDTSFKPLAILKAPEMKLIFAHHSYDFNMYTYYSYDIELKQLEIIHGPTNGHAHWHVNSFANC